MKNIVVKWFAAYREATGLSSEKVETAAETAAELFGEMAVKHADLASFSGALVAINDEMKDRDSSFSEGDEVLFFPPVAGG
jgi:molybdopterin converting factor small subunit